MQIMMFILQNAKIIEEVPSSSTNRQLFVLMAIFPHPLTTLPVIMYAQVEIITIQIPRRV
jgi:hypothetical protein